MSVLPWVFLLFLASQPVDQMPVSTAFEQDEDYLRSAIESGDVARAMIASSSVLYHWQNDALFGEMIDHLMLRAYTNRPPKDLADEYQGRLMVVTPGAPWEIWLETGLIALTFWDHENAMRCFNECLKEGAIPGNPYVHLLMGRSFLQQERFAEAQAAYLDAVSAASEDAATAFHVRFLYVNDLYKAGKHQLAQCGEGPICQSLASPYPLERAFGIYETLMYAWSLGDTAEIARLVDELETVLHQARARPDSPFEIRRILEAQNYLRRIKQAQTGDDYIAMILDEEAGWFDEWSSNYPPIRNRLQKWVTKHPITEYTQLQDEEQRFALRSTHFSYLTAAARSAAPEEADELAEQGIRSLIENVPMDARTEGDVISWHLILANCLDNQKRFHEAIEVLKKASGLITPESLQHRLLLLQTDHVISELQALEESSR
jgi:tetratricopeptide (TPR) repeat protein